MTIPVFTAGTVLTAAELNAALDDAAALPMTQPNTWADAQTFDGTINQSPGAGANNQGPFLQASDMVSDYIVSGINPTVPSPASLTMTIPAGTAFVLGQRTLLQAAVADTYPASSDTYFSMTNTGQVAYTSVANGAAAPAAPANAINLLKVVTSATAITAVANITPTQPGVPDAVFPGSMVNLGQTDSLYQSSLLSISSTTTAGAITATAAQLAGQYLANGATQTAAFTVTTDTAVNILAAMPNAVVGTAFKFRLINNDQSATGYAGTLAGGTGVTVGTILPNPAVGQGNWEDYIFTFTAVGSTPTLTVEAVGGSSLGLL
ncbi:MAG: hypothetical protein ACYC0Z_14905 [Acidobacteriaceae bacterium]